jgi:hypothetical protein
MNIYTRVRLDVLRPAVDRMDGVLGGPALSPLSPKGPSRDRREPLTWAQPEGFEPPTF